MSEETSNEKQAEGRVMRDLQRRPRSRKNREYVLISGERVKRTDIGWTDEDETEEAERKKT
ncbi:MAG: hypothetical protein ACFFDJ_08450 [Candidatus Odinarchaeota archaeon]